MLNMCASREMSYSMLSLYKCELKLASFEKNYTIPQKFRWKCGGRSKFGDEGGEAARWAEVMHLPRFGHVIENTSAAFTYQDFKPGFVTCDQLDWMLCCYLCLRSQGILPWVPQFYLDTMRRAVGGKEQRKFDLDDGSAGLKFVENIPMCARSSDDIMTLSSPILR